MLVHLLLFCAVVHLKIKSSSVVDIAAMEWCCGRCWPAKRRTKDLKIIRLSSALVPINSVFPSLLLVRSHSNSSSNVRIVCSSNWLVFVDCFLPIILLHAVWSAIGTILSSVCPCDCDAVLCGAQGRCRGWKLYRRVPRRALPVHFRHFYCRMYRFATKHSDRLRAAMHQRQTLVWNSN